MDDVELRGRMLAIEMLLVEQLVTDGASARQMADRYLGRFSDILAGEANGFGGREVVAAAHTAMWEILDRVIRLSDLRDRLSR